MKCWKKEVGFLVNFGLPSINSKRIIFKERQGAFVEDYEPIRILISTKNKVFLRGVRTAIFSIFRMHGLGYAETIYQKLLLKELSYLDINYSPSTLIPLKYKATSIRNFEIKMPLIDNQFICGVVALKDSINYDKVRMKTYLKELNLPFGLLIHFGKEKLEIYGIKARN